MHPSVAPIQHRLLSVVNDFLNAFDNGSLHTITSQWLQLEEDVVKNRQPGSHDTGALAVDVASCIEELCDAFINLPPLDNGVNHRLSGVLSAPADDHIPPNSPVPNQSPYVKPASEWLLKNLHNPFPSAEFREQLSTTHSCPRKNIDTWFNEARKRIGWNSLRKKHFGSRKEMVDAASSFFRDHVTSAEFDDEFLRMAEKAKDLYSKRLATSELMQKLDRSVKTMSDEVKKQADEEKRERQLEKRRASHTREDKAVPPPTLGRKRRLHDDEDDQPLRKRSRSHDDEGDDNPTESTSATMPLPPSSICGKRRSSDSSHDRPQKRPRISSAPTPMMLPTFPLLGDWFTQSQSQLPTDAECTYDISSWLASMDSLSDADSSGVTTPTDFPLTIPLPDINQVNALLELDAAATASSSFLPPSTVDPFDLCSPPEYNYTPSDLLNFDFNSSLFELGTFDTSLGALDPAFSIGVVA